MVYLQRLVGGAVRIAYVLYPGFTALDVVGPYEVISRWPGAEVLASLIPNARMLIVPGNHGDYLGELAAAAGGSGPLQRTLPFVVDFLDKPERPGD